MSKLRWISLMSEVAEPFCRGLTAYLNQQMAQQQLAEVEFVEGIEYAERRQMVVHGVVDMAWICGVDYVLNADRLDWSYQPLAALCMNDSPKPVYYSDMIVRTDSAFRSFGDLRDQLERILSTMHQTFDGQALLGRWHTSRFDTGGDSDYDAIRASLCKV